jgi:hypothetical protein
MNFVNDDDQDYQSNNPENDRDYENYLKIVRMSKNGTLNPNKNQEHLADTNMIQSIPQNATTVATSQMHTMERNGYKDSMDQHNNSNFQEMIEEEMSGNFNPNKISHSYYKGAHPTEMICSSRQSIVLNPLTDFMVS